MPELDPARIRALLGETRAAAAALSAMPASARAEAIAHAARALLDASEPLGGELRAALRASTGLTPPVIEHGLRTTLSLFERDTLLSLLAARPHSELQRVAAPALAVVVLAGNVFSAAARPLLLPLLCGTAVLAKASSADDALPRFLQRALSAADPRFGAACAVVTYARDEAQLTHALLDGAELVSAYGSDETIAALAAGLRPGARLLAHGHGLAAIVVARAALGSEPAARALAARIALDVAAYDQRGCLSPHFVLLEAGAAVDARSFARLLAGALHDVERVLPRGPLPPHAAAAQLQWRGVAAALGELHATAHYAVSYEADHPLRPSPGYRNLALYDVPDLAAAPARLAPFRRHLKALGLALAPLPPLPAPLAAEPAPLPAEPASLAPPHASSHAPPHAPAHAPTTLAALAPYRCLPGALQTPPLDAALDGLHPLAGLLA